MIRKERKVPIRIQKLEALQRRIREVHPAKTNIDEELRRRWKGFRGEQSLDYHLSFLPDEKFHILHDLRLLHKKNLYFQMDTVMISSRFIVLLEVKNLSGSIYFDKKFNQLIRTYDGQEEAFSDPIGQVKRQSWQLENWLAKHKLPPIPIDYLVVISDSSTIIRADPHYTEAYQKVIHSAMLPSKIELFYSRYKKDILTEKEMNKISRLLIKKHVPLNQDILMKFNLSKSDILTGVHCSICFKLPVEKIRGGWYCPRCQSTQKDAHIATLKDYYLLFGEEITNQKLREFLHISSTSIATKLLSSLNYQFTGSRKNRVYSISLRE